MENRNIRVEAARSEAIRRFVCAEVWACITDFSAYLGAEDFENDYDLECPTCGQRIDPSDEEALEDDDYEGTGMRVYICPNCGAEFLEDDAYVSKDIFEYWIVSPFLGKLLKEHGEPIIERKLGWIWGRTCTGQAIELDGVMEAICDEIGLFGDSPKESTK